MATTHTDLCAKGLHEMTPENTYVPPNFPGQRMCRTCKRLAQRAHEAERRARNIAAGLTAMGYERKRAN